MKLGKPSMKNGLSRLVWPGAAVLGLLGGIGVAAFGRGARKGRRARKQAHQRELDHPGVSGDERLIEPLGAGIAWGQLDQIGGKYTGVPYSLTRQIIILGRQADCDIILDDDRASRYHAFLTWDHGRGYIRDNDSLNGSAVNGQRAKGPVLLRHGDIIEAGGAEYRFTYAEVTGLAAFDAQPTEKIAMPGTLAKAADFAPVRARLTALTGPEPGRSWPVVSGAVTIGRGGDNLVVLPHASVSRLHAQIVVQPTGLFVQDIGSSNGTSVNGEHIEAPLALADNDHIQIGDILLVVKMEQPATPDQPEDAPTQRLPAAGSSPNVATGFSPARRAAMTRPGPRRPLPSQPAPQPPEAHPPISAFPNGNQSAPSFPSQSQPGPQFKPPLPTHPLPPSTDAARRLPRFQPPPPKDEGER